MKPENLICSNCKRKQSIGYYFSCPNCNGILFVEYKHEFDRRAFDNQVLTGRTIHQKFLQFLPLSRPESALTLFEGMTPLVQSEKLKDHVGSRKLYFKDEGRNPSGSFKDRAIAVGANLATEMGVKDVVTASTGNAGASLSGYSARIGLNCHMIIPASASVVKLAQALAYGSDIIPISGTVDDALTLLRACYDDFGWVPIPTSAAYNPYQIEGAKTIMYEICDAFGWESPDWVVYPVGGGDGITSGWMGIQDLRAADLIRGSPSLVGVQAESCSPVTNSFKEGSENIKPVWNSKTVASSINVGLPPTGLLALRAVRNTDGIMVTCSDEEMLSSQDSIANQEGIFTEPSSAATISATSQLIRDGTIKASESVVCVLTGSGLKDPYSIASRHKLPEAIPPDIDSLKKRMLYHGRLERK